MFLILIFLSWPMYLMTLIWYIKKIKAYSILRKRTDADELYLSYAKTTLMYARILFYAPLLAGMGQPRFADRIAAFIICIVVGQSIVKAGEKELLAGNIMTDADYKQDAMYLWTVAALTAILTVLNFYGFMTFEMPG